MGDYRASNIIKNEIEVLNKSINRLNSLNSIYSNRVRKNNESIDGFKTKSEETQKLIDNTKDPIELKRLITLQKTYQETVKSLNNLNRDLGDTISSNNDKLETQTEELSNLNKELSETLRYEGRLKERSQITYVDLDNELNTNLLLPSTINITAGTEVEILTDYNSNTYIKIGKFNSSISGSTSKSLDYSKIIIDNFSSNGDFEGGIKNPRLPHIDGYVSDETGEVSVKSNNYSSYTIQSFNYDVSISLGGYKFLLFDYENLFTDNTIWVQLNSVDGGIKVAQ